MNNYSSTQFSRLGILLFFTCFLILNFILGYIGHYGFDDMEYARLAWGWTKGEFDPSNHFSFRFGLLLPTAIAYALFGLNDLSSALPSLLASIATLYFVYLFLKEEKLSILLIALALTAFYPWFLRYSYLLMPDSFICLSFIACSFFLWKSRSAQNGLFVAIGFVLSLFLGFISKGTIVLILPLLVFFFILDLKNKRNIAFWTWSLVLGIGILLIYFLLIDFISGDPFTRFNVIQENSYLNRCTYSEQSKNILFKRISIEFLELLSNNFLLLLYAILGLLFLSLSIKRKIDFNHKAHFLLTVTTIVVLSSNFMSISLQSYNPMCINIRHYLFLSPLAAMTLALFLEKEVIGNSIRWWIIPLIVAVNIYSFELDSIDYYLAILSPSVVLIIYLIFIQKPWSNKYLASLLPFVFLFKPIEMISSSESASYEIRKAFIEEKLINDKEQKLVLTDPVSVNLGEYYSSFENEFTRFTDYRYYKPELDKQSEPAYYLKSWHHEQKSFIVNSQIPFYLKKSTNNKPIAEIENEGIALYKINSFKPVKREENLIFSAINRFEGRNDPWSDRNDLLTSDPKNEKNQVIRVPYYSSTFNLALDSLTAEQSTLYISSSAMIYFQDASAAEFIMSIEKDGKSLVYSSQKIDPLIGSYSNWWKVSLGEMVDVTSEIEGAELKIYIWNMDQNTFYMDDFEVEIFAE